MNVDLTRYAAGAFTDQDVTGCTGISVRKWRELIKVGAVRTITKDRGRSRVRLCDAVTLMRVALIAALNQAGFSTVVAGLIAYFLPLDQLLYTLWDPLQYLESWSESDRKLPAILRADTDWLETETPARADPEKDWLVEIYEGRFVAVVFGAKATPCIYGDVRDDGTRFVRWFASRYVKGASDEFKRVWLPHNIDGFVKYWERASTSADQVDLGFLGYTYENHDAEGDPLSRHAYAIAHRSVFKTTVNVSLAIRTALRRYFGVEARLAEAPKQT
jgi:hypothetical protein